MHAWENRQFCRYSSAITNEIYLHFGALNRIDLQTTLYKPTNVCKAVDTSTFAHQDFLKTVMWHFSSYASNNGFFQCRESGVRIPQSSTKCKSAAQWSCINVDCSTEATAIHNAASGDVIKLTSEKWVSF